LFLLLRYATLLALPQSLRMSALVCMPALGRWAMVTVAWLSHYARVEGGLAAPFLSHLSFIHVLCSTVVLCAALVLGFGTKGAAVAMLCGVMVVGIGWAGCRRWFGGVTGDTLGAINELTETVFLLLVPVILWLR
jgi:adenosylcobinamide-GDP ribazoletransferase